MKRKDIGYAIALALLVIGITGGLYLLVQTHHAVYGSVIDWMGQHVAFAEYFRDNFYETHQLYPDFSMQLGAGQNMIEFGYYGLLRPELLVSYLLPMVKMSTYMICSSIIMTIISVELFYYWIRKQGISEFNSAFATVIFLCAGPVIFQTHKHMLFVNYMPWMILTCIGIQRYLKKGKSDAMIIGIFLMIMASYFYSVSAIFMCGLYAIYEIIRQKEDISLADFAKTLTRVVGHMLIGIGIACFFLVPTAVMMMSSHRESLQAPSLAQLFMPDLDISALTYTAYLTNAYSAGMCVIAWAAVLFFLFQKKKSSRILGLFILLLTIIPIFCYLLNGLQYIREKSLITMIPLAAYMVARMLHEMKDTSRKFFWLIPVIILPLFFIKIQQQKVYYLIDCILCITMLLVYKNTKRKRLIVIYLLFPLFLLMPANKSEHFLKQSDLAKYENGTKKKMVQDVLDQDTSLYRFDDLDFTLRTSNQVLDQRMYKTTLYSSNKNNDYANFFSNVMAMPGTASNNSNITAGRNSFFQSMMSVKYMYTEGSTPLHYEKIIEKEDGSSIIKNSDVLPMAYASSDVLSSSQFEKLAYPYSMEAIYNNTVVDHAAEQELSSNIQKVQPSYKVLKIDDSIKIKKTKNGYKIKSSKKGKVILQLDEPINNQMLILDMTIRNVKSKKTIVSMTINGVTNQRGADNDLYSNKKENFRFVLDKRSSWKKLTISLNKGEYEIQNPKAYLVDGTILTNRVKSVDPLIADRDSNGIMSGTIDVRSDGYFVTSLPYQKGFKIQLDGKDIDYEKVNTAFVGFPITKGQHTVSISFEMPGKKIGILISVASLLLAAILFFKKFVISKKKRSV